MSHTVHPYSHRLGIIRDWKSRWFSKDKKKFRENLQADTEIRRFLDKRLRGMFVNDIHIERSEKALRIIIKTSRPGIIIGRNGEGSVKLRADIEKLLNKKGLKDENQELKIDIEEVKSPEAQAELVSQMVADGLEKRMPFRRVLKQTAEKVMANRDVKGVRISVAGRLGGAEMARKEEIKKGRIPLQTFRADIDFSTYRAHLPYGVIGIKTWIYRGDIFDKGGNNVNNN